MARARGTPWLVSTASPVPRMRNAASEFTGRVATPRTASERIAPVEERRHERIKHPVGEPTLNAVYQVVGEDGLSGPIPA